MLAETITATLLHLFLNTNKQKTLITWTISAACTGFGNHGRVCGGHGVYPRASSPSRVTSAQSATWTMHFCDMFSPNLALNGCAYTCSPSFTHMFNNSRCEGVAW